MNLRWQVLEVLWLHSMNSHLSCLPRQLTKHTKQHLYQMDTLSKSSHHKYEAWGLPQELDTKEELCLCVPGGWNSLDVFKEEQGMRL